jgi:chitodextrinase
MRKLLIAAATIATAAFAANAYAAHTVQPAYYIHGKVEAVDPAKKTVTIAGHTFTGLTEYDAKHLYAGFEVDATYVLDANNVMRLVWITDEEDVTKRAD